MIHSSFTYRILTLLIFLSLLFHSHSIFAQNTNKKVYIGLFKSFQSTENPEISKKIQEEFLAKSKDLEMIKGSSTDTNQTLREAKEKNASLAIDGYYKKKESANLEIFIQIYDVDTGSIIDAYHASFSFPELEGVKLDPNEIKKTDSEIIADAVKKTITKIRTNPQKKVKEESIDESLVNQPIYEKNKFKIAKSDVKASEEVFRLLQENEVITASRTKESLIDVPASTIVITEKDIKERGYFSLDELLTDLPGMDVVYTHGTDYTNAYQRGYRTPFTSRTLLMVNGVVENDLWAQVATFSRQYPVSNIKRVEVIYGPASAVYGPNAFLGIINIITKDGKELNSNGVRGNASAQYLGGSYKGYSADGAANAKIGDFTIATSAKRYEGEDPNFSKYGRYQSNYWSMNPYIWGPILYYGNGGVPFGPYKDPVNDWGNFTTMTYETLKFGLSFWEKNEGYGPYYPSDKSQPSAIWSKRQVNFFIENDVELSSKVRSFTQIVFKDHRIFGNWAEADDYPYTGKDMFSYVSFTRWNSRSKGLQANQNLEIEVNSYLKLISGIKIEFKKLTKQYDIPGYYYSSSFSSIPFFNKDVNPYIKEAYPSGYGIVPSTDLLYNKPPSPKAEMPDENTIGTIDRGAFLLSIINIGKFRFSPGVRYDHNSLYGQSINPRVTGIYKFTENNAIKLLYGEAFNEPLPIQLFGGWSGRTADITLKPEKARSYEIIYFHQGKSFLNEFSVYYSRYENVIKESAKNAGKRRVYGFEYRLKYSFENFIPQSEKISIYFNYTFTESLSSIYYDHKLAPYIKGEAWMEGETALKQYEYIYSDLSPNLPRKTKYTTLGDIAPHKFNIGFNLPVMERWNINLRGNYVGKRQLYGRNPLRDKGITIDPYFLLHLTISYTITEYGFLSLKIGNLLNHTYLHPGGEGADA